MARSQTDENTIPEFTAAQVAWIQKIARPQVPGIPPPEWSNPCERMALAAAFEAGKNFIVSQVVGVYRTQTERQKGGGSRVRTRRRR